MENCSFLAGADFHLGSKLFNIPELGQDLLDTFERFVSKAIELKVDQVFIVGDLYDNQRPSEQVVSFVTKQCQRLEKAGIVVIGISGDHDKASDSKTWIQDVNSVEPPANYPNLFGMNYEDFLNIPECLKRISDKDAPLVEWMFFHGQVPELFKFTTPKKHLDFANSNLDRFINLKGIILGDIHSPLEGTIPLHGKEIYIGYCGSPGMVRTDEIGHKNGLLYYDKAKLQRIPFPLDREFHRLKMGTDKPVTHLNIDADKKKPVYLLEYTPETKDELLKFKDYYDKFIVRTSMVKGNYQPEAVNIRSELKTSDRISTVLNNSAVPESVSKLALELISTEDPKKILDAFKQESLK